jgi:flagellar motor switch protein FliN/FliY
MSPESPAVPEAEIQNYQQTWTECISRVLEQIAGSPFTVEAPPAEDVDSHFKAAVESGVWVRFTAAKRVRFSDKRLTGEQGFLVASSDALRLAQTFMGEPVDEKASFSNDHRDAVEELFRQFAGMAATALKAKLGGEVELQFSGNERPSWTPAVQAGFRFASQKFPPFILHFQISAELAELLAALQSEADQPAADKPAAEQPQPAAESTPAGQPPAEASEKDAALAEANEAATPAEISKRDDNLELLLDVELEVTLRFGERQMLLRDILELSPGAVVELDRKLQEPAELLTAGKVMARGEVVIVDGNYGLRVTEIVPPQHRMSSLGK